MIEFARLHNHHSKIQYVIADITKPDTIKEEWLQKFDLITSFLVLHWTPNQYSNLQNIKTLLSANGEVLLLFLFESHLVHVSELMKTEKWSHHFQGFQEEWRLNPDWEEYRDWLYPEGVKGYRRMVESLGYSVKSCLITSLDDFVFPDRQSAKTWFSVILPHVKRIPDTELSEFLDDALDIYNILEKPCSK